MTDLVLAAGKAAVIVVALGFLLLAAASLRRRLWSGVIGFGLCAGVSLRAAGIV